MIHYRNRPKDKITKEAIGDLHKSIKLRALRRLPEDLSNPIKSSDWVSRLKMNERDRKSDKSNESHQNRRCPKKTKHKKNGIVLKAGNDTYLNEYVHNFEIDLNPTRFWNNLSTGAYLKQKFEWLGIKLETVLIKINNDNDVLQWRFSSISETIDSYIDTFDDTYLFPKATDLDLILQFYEDLGDNNRIAEKDIYVFILSLNKPMIQKQYLLHWIRHTYGLSCNQVCISSILPPSINDNQELIEIRLIALLCHFYDVSPKKLSSLQLCSIVSIKPLFCFRSTCGKCLLILPEVYTFYLSSKITTMEKCQEDRWNSNQERLCENFCYHGLNVLFEKEYIRELIETLKEKSYEAKIDFENMYKDPSKYVRPFDPDQFSKTFWVNSFPAHIATSSDIPLPSRLKDADLVHIKLDPDEFSKFYSEVPRQISSTLEKEYKNNFQIWSSTKMRKK